MKIYFKLINKWKFLFGKQPVIPEYSLKRAEIERLRILYGYSVFIESGTFLGDTVDFFKDKFEQVLSIELSEDLANKAQYRFSNDSNVRIVCGDSGMVLGPILDVIKSPALIWLDGHFSSEFFIGDQWIATAKGSKETPVLEELSLILNNSLPHVIMIDDARLFVGLNDYPSVGTIRRMVKARKRNYMVLVQNDIIYILPPQ